jgi:hypothetical protein
VKAGDSTLRFRAILEGIAGEQFLVDPFSAYAETVTVASYENRDANLTGGVLYTHNVNAPVIRKKFAEFLATNLESVSLAANAIAAATAVTLTNVLNGMGNATHWIVIDPYTVECEVRRAGTVSGNIVTFTTPLAYTHSENDPVLLVDKPALNVKWFGAKGDGSTNDDTPLTRVIEACSDGDTIYCPSGTYVITATLEITRRLQVVGDGLGTIFDYRGTGNVIQIDGSERLEGDVNGVLISDMVISGRSGSQNAVWMRKCHRSRFRNIYIRGCGEAGFYIYGSLLNIFDNCQVSINLPAFVPSPATPKYGVRLINDGTFNPNANTFANLVVEGIVTSPGIGVALPDGVLSNVFIGGTSEGNLIGVQLGDSVGTGTLSNTFIAFHTEANGQDWDIKYASGQPEYNVVLGNNQIGLYNWNYLMSLTVDDGTSITPSIRFFSDLDTGIYKSGGVLAIAHGGLPRLSVSDDYIFLANLVLPGANDAIDLGDIGVGMRFRNIDLTQEARADRLRVAVRTTAPSPTLGMIAYANGTTWNPGGGEGLYVYTSSGWTKL